MRFAQEKKVIARESPLVTDAKHGLIRCGGEALQPTNNGALICLWAEDVNRMTGTERQRPWFPKGAALLRRRARGVSASGTARAT